MPKKKTLKQRNPLLYSLFNLRFGDALRIVQKNRTVKSPKRTEKRIEIHFDPHRQQPYAKTIFNLTGNKRPHIPGMKNNGKILKRGQ